MQWQYGDYIEAVSGGAVRAWYRAWTAVCSPVPTMQTAINWNRTGLLAAMPTEFLVGVPGIMNGEYTHQHSAVAMLSAVYSLQAEWRATSGAARAAIGRTAYAAQRAEQQLFNVPMWHPPR